MISYSEPIYPFFLNNSHKYFISFTFNSSFGLYSNDVNTFDSMSFG